jgi:DNA-binding MarR family transcriptional regulator
VGAAAEAAEALYRLLTIAVRRTPRDLSLTAAATLATLERAGPRRITDLAASEGVTQPSMTALITSLERSGLVERQPDPTDQRAVLVALTADGTDRLHARRHAGTAAFAQLISQLPAAEIARLRDAAPALRHLRELHDDERTSPPAGPHRS